MAPELRSSLGHGVKTLLHELDHVGTPKSPLTPHLDWLREGRAEAFARWPGRIREAGRMLGLDVTDDIGKQADLDGPYQEEVAAVRTLLGLAGIDAARRSSFPEAQALLSVADETQLASRIAAAVARQHASSPSEDAAIRRMVEHLVNERIAPDGSNADMRVVDRLKELMTESTAP